MHVPTHQFITYYSEEVSAMVSDKLKVTPQSLLELEYGSQKLQKFANIVIKNNDYSSNRVTIKLKQIACKMTLVVI